jgi:hypothetical protein
MIDNMRRRTRQRLLSALLLTPCVAVGLVWFDSYFEKVEVAFDVTGPPWSSYFVESYWGALRVESRGPTGNPLYHSWASVSGPDVRDRFRGFGPNGRVLLLPYWVLIAPAALVPLLAYAIRLYAVRRIPADTAPCPECGYDLRASPERCPECGTLPAI